MVNAGEDGNRYFFNNIDVQFMRGGIFWYQGNQAAITNQQLGLVGFHFWLQKGY